MYLGCSGGKGTVGVHCGSFGSCIGTVQCRGLQNRELWEELDITGLLDVSVLSMRWWVPGADSAERLWEHGGQVS